MMSIPRQSLPDRHQAYGQRSEACCQAMARRLGVQTMVLSKLTSSPFAAALLPAEAGRRTVARKVITMVLKRLPKRPRPAPD